MTTMGSDAFSWFEIPRPLIQPALRALKSGNTAIDALFYDVGRMVTDLFLHGSTIVKGPDVSLSPRFAGMTKGFTQLDLSASSNPPGSILVVDAGRPPSITQFENLEAFVSWADTNGKSIRTASVTGVGSSALGSAAFAWNVSTALDEPVAAIVPGYGVADAIHQGLDGWFGVYNLWVKQMVGQVLAQTTWPAARSDRHPIMKAPDDAEAAPAASPFWRGSLPPLPTGCAQSSGVMHALLESMPTINRVFGHSKGAVAIKNALHSLPPETTRRLHVVTFGWSMPEDIPTAGYSQFLGRMDKLGRVHSWCNPSPLIPTHHGTNTSIPHSMPVSILTRLAMIEQGAAATRNLAPADQVAGTTTIGRPNLVQLDEEGIEGVVARIHIVDESAYDDAAD
jgi:hypothetical protein